MVANKNAAECETLIKAFLTLKPAGSVGTVPRDKCWHHKGPPTPRVAFLYSEYTIRGTYMSGTLLLLLAARNRISALE